MPKIFPPFLPGVAQEKFFFCTILCRILRKILHETKFGTKIVKQVSNKFAPFAQNFAQNLFCAEFCTKIIFATVCNFLIRVSMLFLYHFKNLHPTTPPQSLAKSRRWEKPAARARPKFPLGVRGTTPSPFGLIKLTPIFTLKST